MINFFLDSNWRQEHIKKIKAYAGNRYTPTLNVELPISEIFEWITRSRKYFNEIRIHYGKLKREFEGISSGYDNEQLQSLYDALQGKVFLLIETLNSIKEYGVNEFPWDEISKCLNEINPIFWEFMQRLREEVDKKGKLQKPDEGDGKRNLIDSYNYTIHCLGLLQEELTYFDEKSRSVKSKVCNHPYLHLLGSAGTGKTHLLCDVVERSYDNENILPAVLVFGEKFVSVGNPFKQIIEQLGLSLTKSQFLRMLDNAGKKAKSRALLIIDALNETNARGFWLANLSLIVNDIRKYPNIALVISSRKGFEKDLIEPALESFFLVEEHRGFEFREWEALNIFFHEYKIPLPEIPLLMPEFQIPLFLRLFCEGYQKRLQRMKGGREIFRGHEGSTYIFEAFVDNVAKKISKKFKITTISNKDIWNAVIKNIAEYMANNDASVIPGDKLLEVVKAAYATIDSEKFILELERNMLLFRLVKNANDVDNIESFDYRFPFQKFSDHLISRYLFKKYEAEFGKSNKNLNTAKKYFSRRRCLGRYLEKSWNRGIVEALSIQCPEFLNGLEFVDVAPYLSNSNLAKDAFIESIIWRKTSAFSAHSFNALRYINNVIIKSRYHHEKLLNAFLTIAALPHHPFKADFLHKKLFGLTMAERDVWWSPFLHTQYGERSGVDRLIEWAWSRHDKSHISDESVRLASVALIWFLTTPNRYVRDKATKALVELLTNRLSVVKELLIQFKDVNDAYVSERLYGVAYGCVIRSKDDKLGKQNLAEWVYFHIFKDGYPPANILLRDYARGVIELALHENLNIRINKNKIKPPYKSDWTNNIPSEKQLKKKFKIDNDTNDNKHNRGVQRIWGSVMYHYGHLADFGRYILGSAVSHWSGRRIDGSDINRKKLFEKFRMDLTDNQRNILDEAIERNSIAFSLNLVNDINHKDSIDNNKIVKNVNDIHAKKSITDFNDFENSVSDQERRIFIHEFKPFLDSYGIRDELAEFNQGLAQRWIFHRVMQLGYDPHLHGKFDATVSYRRDDRSENKPERIGKKYQWIALYELLARLSDNFEYKEASWNNVQAGYCGPWQLSIRNIDVSCTIKGKYKTGLDGLPEFNRSQNPMYRVWREKIPDIDWLKLTKDLPDPKKCLSYVDSDGREWLVLESFVEWAPELPVEIEKYSIPSRRLYYIIKSYVVNKSELSLMYNWAKRQRFTGRWMPESHEFYNIFLGEIPWAPAFIDMNKERWSDDGWTKESQNDDLPVKVMVSDDECVVVKGASSDGSQLELPNIKLPAKSIIDHMQLVDRYLDGRFYDDVGNLVAFDPRILGVLNHKCLLIRTDKFYEFLSVNNYAIIWTVLGEKNIIGGRGDGQTKGWLEIDGVYTLDEANKIVGRKKSRFGR